MLHPRDADPGPWTCPRHGVRKGKCVNEERVRQILDIESQAQTIYRDAEREAEELVHQAEQEAQALVDAAQQDAHVQAKALVDQARDQDACDVIVSQADDEAARIENLARSHFDRAVGYVLDRLAGKA